MEINNIVFIVHFLRFYIFNNSEILNNGDIKPNKLYDLTILV